MPAPTNTSAGTATDLGVLPASITQDVTNGAGTTYTVWYKWLATFTGQLELWGYGGLGAGYQPTLFVWTNVGVTAYVPGSQIAGQEIPVSIPVVSGTTYYFQFVTNSGVISPAILTISAIKFVETTGWSAGDIFVNDDTHGFPLVVLSSTNAAPKKYIQNFPEGEGGDILPSGISCWENGTLGGVSIYDATLTLIIDVVTTFGRQISSNRSNKFYIGQRGGGVTHSSATTVSSAGVLGPTTWTFEAAGLVGLAPSPDETILYYTGTVSSINTPVHRWDLVNNIQLSDLAAAPGAGISFTQDVLVLSDGTILVGYCSVGSAYVKRYSAAGAVLNTYNIPAGQFRAAALSTDRICHAEDSPTHFYYWGHAASGISYFHKINVSTGAISTVSARQFEGGVYSGSVTATPDARTGHSFCCPFIVAQLNNPSTRGLYKLVEGKTNDIGTVIPTPMFRTFLAGDE